MHGGNQPRPNRLLILFLFTDLLINILSFGLPFFWDTILTSTIAQHFYRNGAGDLIIPIQWNAGHPSFFGLYIAGLWKLLGKSLWVSHLAILPFLWLRSWSIWSLGYHLKFSGIQTFSAWFLMLLTPAILTQSLLVSYDVAMLGAFLFVVSGIVSSSNWKLITGSILLVLLSVRGLQVLAALLALSFLYALIVRQDKRPYISVLYYFPAMLIAFGWYLYHYKITGWAIISPSESWAGHREFLSITSMRGQGIALSRACLEQGSIVLWLVFFWALWNNSLRKLGRSQLFLALAVFVVLSICLAPLLLISAPILNRYTMILQATIILSITAINFPLKKWVVGAAAIILFSGHGWIYTGISNSWDTSIAHIPFFKLRQQAFSYLENQGIPKDRVATHFPLYASFAQTDLTTDTFRLISLHDQKKNFEYILRSNISNDFSQPDLQLIGSGFVTDTTFCNKWMYMNIYKRKGL